MVSNLNHGNVHRFSAGHLFTNISLSIFKEYRCLLASNGFNVNHINICYLYKNETEEQQKRDFLEGVAKVSVRDGNKRSQRGFVWEVEIFLVHKTRFCFQSVSLRIPLSFECRFNIVPYTGFDPLTLL